MIVFGTRLFGTTDAVPGVFYITTKFFHIDFIPLVPIKSYLVIGGTRAVEIPVHGKSIGVAWIRFLAGCFGLGMLIWLIIASLDYSDYPAEEIFVDELLPSCIGFGIGAAVVYFAMCHSITRNASHERATEIIMLYMNESTPNGAAGRQLQTLVDRHFGLSLELAEASIISVEAESDAIDGLVVAEDAVELTAAKQGGADRTPPPTTTKEDPNMSPYSDDPNNDSSNEIV